MKANTPKGNGDQTLKFGPKGEIDLVEKKEKTPNKKVFKGESLTEIKQRLREQVLPKGEAVVAK